MLLDLPCFCFLEISLCTPRASQETRTLSGILKQDGALKVSCPVQIHMGGIPAEGCSEWEGEVTSLLAEVSKCQNMNILSLLNNVWGLASMLGFVFNQY